MIQQGGADNWMRIINKFLNVDQISSDSLLSFFSPLEDFIDDLEEDFQPNAVVNGEVELEELEKKVIEEVNSLSTTTIVTTTINTATKSSVVKKKVINTVPLHKQNNEKSNINIVGNTNKSLESKSSIYIKHSSNDELENRNVSKSEASTRVPLEESLPNSLDTEQGKKPKINTNKAVWAVGAVLLAIIIVCAIAIFGRQRCRKTPKNRRYI